MTNVQVYRLQVPLEVIQQVTIKIKTILKPGSMHNNTMMQANESGLHPDSSLKAQHLQTLTTLMPGQWMDGVVSWL